MPSVSARCGTIRTKLKKTMIKIHMCNFWDIKKVPRNNLFYVLKSWILFRKSDFYISLNMEYMNSLQILRAVRHWQSSANLAELWLLGKNLQLYLKLWRVGVILCNQTASLYLHHCLTYLCVFDENPYQVNQLNNYCSCRTHNSWCGGSFHFVLFFDAWMNVMH